MNLRRRVASITPLPLKTFVYERLSQAKVARMLRAKKRFRSKRTSGVRTSAGFPPGVNLVGYVRGQLGLGVIARGMASALAEAEVPFNILNIDSLKPFQNPDLTWAHKEVSSSDYDTTVVCMNPDYSPYLRTYLPSELIGDRYVVANWFWELEDIPDEWLKELDYIDEIWASSRFIEASISKRVSVPVTYIPPVVKLKSETNISRSSLVLPENAYLFLAMFDTNSILQRKNPLGVVQAFKNAFHGDDNSVALIMKFNNPDYNQPDFQKVVEEMESHQNILLLDKVMERDEITSLFRKADCFVSLHRSEGFGLGPAEAMSLGKPAILTNWSGNIDYMTSDNSIAIDYELVKLGQDYGPYEAWQQWAEPDLEQATYWMKRIVQDTELAQRIGARARETIESQFSPAVVGKIITSRLEQCRSGF